MEEEYLEKIEELESEISELKANIADLESNYDSVNIEFSELEEKYSKLEDENTELEGKNDELEEENYILEKHGQRLFDVDNLENQYKFDAFLEYHDKYNSTDFELVLKDGASFKSRILELERNIDDLEYEIIKLESEKSDLDESSFNTDNLEDKYKFETFIEYQDKYTSLEFEKLLKNGVNR